MSDRITTPTIHQLTEELAGMNDWYSLGVALLVPVSKLKEIKALSPQEGIAQWRIDLLQHWLDSTPTASWSDIITALEKIDHHTLSTRLRSKYLPSATTTTAQQQCFTTTASSTTAVTSSSVSTTATSTSTSANVQSTTHADVQYVSEAYRIDFEDLESEFVQLFIDVTEIVEKDETVTMEKLKKFLSRFRELRASLARAGTIVDLLDIIQDHSSFTCCSRLQHVARYFKITGAAKKIEGYLKYVKRFCSQKLSKHIYMKPFVTGKTTEITPSTTITFKLEWRPDDKTLSNIQSVLRQAFNYHCINVHIVVVSGGSIRVLCYSPLHVMKHLVRLAQVNKKVLVESGVTYLRVGDTIVVDNSGQNEISLVEDLVFQLTIALQLKDYSQHMLISGGDSAAEDVVKKWAVPHSSASVPTSSRGVWLISVKQAMLILSGKPNGSFLVWERSGKPVYAPSSSSINTHVISVVVNGRVLHFPIYKKGSYYGPLTNEQYPSIEILIAHSSRTGFKTEENTPVKLTNQLIPDKDTLANLPSDTPPIIQRFTFSDVALLPKHYPHHDESTWFCPLLSKEESILLLRGRVDETFLIRATELSGPSHVYTVDVVVQKEVVSVCVYKECGWLQLGTWHKRYDSINTLVMCYATAAITILVGDHEVLVYLRYPVHSSQYYKQRSSHSV